MMTECNNKECRFNDSGKEAYRCPICKECGATHHTINEECTSCWNCQKDSIMRNHVEPYTNKDGTISVPLGDADRMLSEYKWAPSMPVSESSKESDIAKLKSLINLPKEWKIEYEYARMLMGDLVNVPDKEKKVLKIYCYTSHYPWGFDDWVEIMCKDINKKMGWTNEDRKENS
ncbi:MAG: hypothetical protein ABIF10_03900 [Candidatus Woesearchaeota archaeon]